MIDSESSRRSDPTTESVQRVQPGRRRRITLKQFALRVEVHDFRTILRAGIGGAPHAVVHGIHVHASDRHQVERPLLHKIRNFTLFRNGDNLIVVLASHVKDALRPRLAPPEIGPFVPL